jgi:hypothetical protein
MPRYWISRSLLVLLAGTASACHPGEPYDLPTTVGPIDIFSLGFFAENSEEKLGGVDAPEMSVPLEETGTALFTVPAGPHLVRVQGISNLPSSYTFVIRQGNVGPLAPSGGAAW